MFGTPLVSRGHSGAVIGVSFVFKGGNENGALFVVPYTREEYIGMPRKKKKSVLTSIKALLAYSSTARLLAALESLDNRGERINERIEKLRARLSEKRKSLPTSPVWEEAVKRVVK
jgi:prefoldin subunit 5